MLRCAGLKSNNPRFLFSSMQLRSRNLRALLLAAAAVLCLAAAQAPDARAQTPTPSPTPPAQQSPCTPPPPSCPTLAPRLIELTAAYKKGTEPLAGDEGLKLARKRFYISPCPFNLDKVQGPGRAPTRRGYYSGVKASEPLIKWLETNNCDTVYCRELRRDEVVCTGPNCVPEFTRAYAEALKKLKNNEELARKWVTNYDDLAKPEFRTGFFKAKSKWLADTVAAVERANGLAAGTIKSVMTDRGGVAYFYDLCPGTYYISNVAPTEVEGERISWETAAITIKGTKAGEPDQLSLTKVFLANVPSKKKRANFFVGKKVSDAASNPTPRAGGEQAGQ